MKKSKLIETLLYLFENNDQYPEGTEVKTPKGIGIVRLSKFPYYSVQLSSGATKTFHDKEIEEYLGKYNINESESDNVVESDFIVIFNTIDTHIGSILSDIRSIEGVTIVRNDNIFDNNEYKNENYKTSLHIKIDPYPFKNIGREDIIKHIAREIAKIPQVKKIQPQNNLPVKQVRSNVPVKSMDDLLEGKTKIRIVQKKLNEIKINTPFPYKLEKNKKWVYFIKDENSSNELYQKLIKDGNWKWMNGEDIQDIPFHNPPSFVSYDERGIGRTYMSSIDFFTKEEYHFLNKHEILKEYINEIKINKPKLGPDLYFKSMSNFGEEIYYKLEELYNNNQTFNQEILDYIYEGYINIDKKFNIKCYPPIYFKEWIDKYLDEPVNSFFMKSSGGFWAGFLDIDGVVNECVANHFEISEDELYDIAQKYWDFFRLPFRRL